MNALSPILSDTDQAHFLERGFVVARHAIPPDWVRQWQDLAWQRLGYDREDPQTWAKERVHLPPSQAVRVEEWAPRAFQAACELIGGRERLREPFFWGDVFVCNMAEGAGQPYREPNAQSPGWHKDGYFFRHFLDSPQQGLLIIAAWTDVVSRGGGTFIAPDSVGVVARFLAEHPEGVKPDVFGALIEQCEVFEEVPAQAGDVILLHPFMLHAVSQNVLRRPRFITNPILMLREPMNFNRRDGAYSLVEHAVLRALDAQSFDFQPAAPRESKLPVWVERA